MFKTCRYLMGVIIFLLVAIPSFSQQSSTQSNFDRLNVKVKQFGDYERDFLDYTKSHRSDLMEFEISSNLQIVASRTGDLLDAVEALLLIYDYISCDLDRETVRRVIKVQLAHYIKRVDLSISEVNHHLSFTKNPAIATSAARMKEDLRETKDLLESISSP
jgi:hypothetical protein